MSFFDSPVLSSPYHLPERHWELGPEGRPTDRILETRRSSELLIALPATSATSARTQTSMVFDDALSTATTDMSPSKIVNELWEDLDVLRQQANPAYRCAVQTYER